ncbi:MAG: methionyl-tRNA formyltransferase [Pseudomonadota bacterium]
MRLAFMGTPAFATPTLTEIVAAGHEVAAVYTKALQRAGRGQKERKSPVHETALIHGLSVETPRSLKKADVQEAFAALDLDAAIVVAYGLILPAPILEAPRLGCFNLHASLLPRWRGAAPIHRAIMAGDHETGVQVMRMEEGLDTGAILLSEKTPIASDDTTASLHDRLSVIGASLMTRALAALERGGAVETPQADDGVTYAEKISSDEARIDWSRPAQELDCHIRGLSPFPGAWFEGPDGARVKALLSSVVETPRTETHSPGQVMSTDGDLVVACGGGRGRGGGAGALALKTLQRAGKSSQSAQAFLNGVGWRPGDRLT